MLQDIRDRATGWIAWVIVILIVIPFAFFGLDQYLLGGGERYAAKVNDVEISLRAYREIHQQQKQRMRTVLRDRYDSAMFDTPAYKVSLANRIVDEEVLAQATRDQVYRVSDVILSQQIRSNSAFQGENGFDQDLYERRLRLQGESTASYEQNLRRSLVVNQLQSGVLDTVIVSKAEIDRLIQMDQQERQIEVLTLKSAHFTDPAAISSGEIDAYYREHADSFRTPEKVKLEYLDLSVDQLARGLELDEQDLRQYYDENSDRFNRAEQRQAAHILVAVDADSDEGVAKAARDKIMDLRLQLDEGADFAELARQSSDDTGSSTTGGDLGVVTRGMMGEEFDRVLFDLDEGQVSEPVRTEFGWHLVKLVKIEQGGAKPFLEVRDEVARDYSQHEAEGLFYELAEKLADLSYENPDNLQVASEALEVGLKTSGFVARSGNQNLATVLNDPKVLEAAFSAEVLQEGNNSELIELDVDHVLVLRVSERVESSPMALAEVSDSIRQQLAIDSAQAEMRKQAEMIRDAYVNGSEVAATAGMEQAEAVWVRRDDIKPDLDLVQSAFALTRPLSGKVNAGVVPMINGNVAVVVLKSVKDGDANGVSADLREVYAGRLRNVAGEADLDASVARLRSEADIEILEANL